MTRHTEESLLSEFSGIRNGIKMLMAKVDGRKYFESCRHSSQEQRNYSSAFWVHYAHRGTLAKIQSLMSRDGPYETFELLAIARNIFENLVWVRLMDLEIDFGLVFYAHLLRGQREHFKGLIDKLTDEANLFDTADEIDTDIVESAARTITLENYSDADRQKWNDELDARTATLDDMVRREFSVYANQATDNGYGFQAHIIRTDAIPHYQAQLDKILAFEAALKAEMPNLLSQRLLSLSSSKWNWSDRAKEVSMEKHYRFIYAYTSRLLHSTPVNLVTEKALTKEEKLLVLDYIVVSTRDLIELIARFTYPGMINVAMVEVV